jgi:adenine-specific DNA-methyltransferase
LISTSRQSDLPAGVRELGPRGSRSVVGDADPAGLPSSATLAVLDAVPLWWERRAAAVGLQGSWTDVFSALESEPLARPSGTVAGGIVELGPEDLGQAYLDSLKPGVRARHGRHYTPPGLADQLWTMTRSALGMTRGRARPLPALIRDPACGAGALLLPVLRDHLRSLASADPRMTLTGLPGLIEGIDSDPTAVWLANVILAAEMLPLLAATPKRSRRPLPSLARLGDGLATDRPRAGAIVMNPPYGRVRLDADDRARFAEVLYGHANLYALFLAAAIDDVGPEGAVGALIPTSFTAGRYFTNLRATVARTAPLRELSFVAERSGVFSGVLQETCLAVFSRRRPRRTIVSNVNGTVDPVARVKSPRGDSPWLIPRRADDAALAAAAAALPLSLGAAGWRVSTGPLVWNRRRDDIHSRAAKNRLPIIWAADLDSPRLRPDARRDLLRYIQPSDVADAATLSLAEPAILVQRTTSPEQRRRIVCVELAEEDLEEWGGTVVVENHVNVLRPSGTNAPLISRATLLALLRGACMDRVIRCLSGSVAVSAYELEHLPLPDESTLASWDRLTAGDLEQAVSSVFRPELLACAN